MDGAAGAPRQARRPRGSRHPRRSGQRGLTLIETVVAVAVLTVGVLGIASSLAAAERIATIDQNQAQLEVTMRQLADWVRSSSSSSCSNGSCPSLPYQTCAGVNAYRASLQNAVSSGALTSASGQTLAIQSVNLSTSGTRSPAGGGAIQTPPQLTCSGTCPGATCVGDWGVQEITVSVKSDISEVTRVVWKSMSW